MKLDRKMYKDIKKMNREKMNSCLEGLYKIAFRDGVESGDNADFRIKLSEVLNSTKGIGIKLYDAVMQTAKEMEQ